MRREPKNSKDLQGKPAGGRFASTIRAADLPTSLSGCAPKTSASQLVPQRSIIGPWLPHENPLAAKAVMTSIDLKMETCDKQTLNDVRRMVMNNAILLSLENNKPRLVIWESSLPIPEECASFMPVDYIVENEYDKANSSHMIARLAEHQKRSINNNSPNSQLHFKPPTVVTNDHFKKMMKQASLSRKLRWSAAVQLVASWNYVSCLAAYHSHDYGQKNVSGTAPRGPQTTKRLKALAAKPELLPDNYSVSPIQNVPFVLYGQLSSMTQKEAKQLIKAYGGTLRFNNWQDTSTDDPPEINGWEVSIIGMFPSSHQKAYETALEEGHFEYWTECITEADFLDMATLLEKQSCF